MTDTNVIKLAQPGTFTNSLTEILRNGARTLLTQAVETEVADFLGRYADLKTETGRQRVVRHGHLPEREIMTGIGPVAVRQPRVRDRETAGGGRFGSARAFCHLTSLPKATFASGLASVPVASFRRFWAVAARRNSPRTPFGPLSRSWSSL